MLFSYQKNGWIKGSAKKVPVKVGVKLYTPL